MTVVAAFDVALLCACAALFARVCWQRYIRTASVIIVCRQHGVQVWTGMQMTEAELRSLPGTRVFRCGECSELHRWAASDAWIAGRRH
jgi:hypothetical protein